METKRKASFVKVLIICKLISASIASMLICTECGNRTEKASKNDEVSLEVTISPKKIKFQDLPTEIAAYIAKGELGNAEFILRANSSSLDIFFKIRDIIPLVATLVEQYIKSGNIDEAVNLERWYYSIIETESYLASNKSYFISIMQPLFDYYMSMEEYLLADEFIFSTDYEKYYNYMERAVTNMVLSGKISEAKTFVTAKSVKFDDVEEIWREERRNKNSNNVADCDKKYKPYFKLTVVTNLMAIINSSTIDEN